MPKRAQCIAFVNHKGGTGKTTSCLSIAGYLAKAGSKVLVVDFDPQANATSGLGIDGSSLEYSMYDVMLDGCDGYRGVSITQVILETDIDNLHLAPSEFDLGVTEVLLQHAKPRVLNRVLEKVRPLYDYILIDSPPGSRLLTLNSLCASDQVVVPVDPSIFSLEALDNLKASLHDIKQMAGHSINKVTCILIRYAKSNVVSRMLHKLNPSQEIEEGVREVFDAVFVVPESEEIYETQRQAAPISHYAPGSKVGKAYAEIAKSISINIEQEPDLENKFERMEAEVQASKARAERLEQELHSLERLSTPKTATTAQMLGLMPLQQSAPNLFSEVLQRYGDLMELALEQQAYRVEHDISGNLRAIADELGYLKAGPRDVVELHSSALKRKTAAASHAKAQAYVEEGRVMVLELMGHLVSYYRTYSLGTTSAKMNDRPMEEVNND